MSFIINLKALIYQMYYICILNILKFDLAQFDLDDYKNQISNFDLNLNHLSFLI